MRFCLIALVVTACGGVDSNIEDQIDIDQGVYGLLISGCDTAGCRDQPATGEQVLVYAPGEASVHARTSSDDDGIYQIDLDVGNYTLCTASCIAITVPFGVVRHDWTSGPGGGRWTD
jgi:hypothetical protein